MRTKDISNYEGKIITSQGIDIDKIPNFYFHLLCYYIEEQQSKGRAPEEITNEEIMLFKVS